MVIWSYLPHEYWVDIVPMSTTFSNVTIEGSSSGDWLTITGPEYLGLEHTWGSYSETKTHWIWVRFLNVSFCVCMPSPGWFLYWEFFIYPLVVCSLDFQVFRGPQWTCGLGIWSSVGWLKLAIDCTLTLYCFLTFVELLQLRTLCLLYWCKHYVNWLKCFTGHLV